MSQSAQASAPRRATRVAIAVLAVLATVGGVQSVGTLAASADPVGPAPVALTQNPTPDEDHLGAIWGDFIDPTMGGFAVADDTTSVEVTLPSELSDHFGESWDYSVGSAKSPEPVSSGTVEAPTSGTLSVRIPGSLIGYGDVILALTNRAPSAPAQQVGLYPILRVHPELSGASASIHLDKSSASDWAHSLRYSATAAASTASPGSLVTLTSGTDTWRSGPDGDWTDPSPVELAISSDNNMQSFARVAGVASADGTSVTFQIPSVSEFNYWPYFPDGVTSRPVRVSVSMLEGPIIGETVRGGSIVVSASLTLVPAPKPAVDRVEGADRFAVAVAVSKEAFPDGAGSAFLVTGANYPDALSAGPAAVHRDAPLLLTRGDSLPPEIAAELTRLKVQDVYVVGGVNSVSDAVVAQVEKLGATVHRIGGADRYAASRALAADTFAGSGSGLVYVATGANFPDALAAGGAAGHANAPVILVNGGAASLDDATKTQLEALGTTSIKIAGGPASVSPGIERDLAAIAPTTRLSGADRIEAAAAINLDAYGTSDRAFLVTGYAFPDALTGSAWAGRLGVPLYVSLPNCVPGAVADAAARQGVTGLTLIGGPASLAPSVQTYTLCPAS
ncbi:cell wall-binding repeat-containing protein [Herbiconiux sp. P18]|uniref:cell wall-binding repeat-containing protein n=1 Tax=Herbiconiux liangxiaofengii TaxID=3342795 RepID=UPI0035B83D81